MLLLVLCACVVLAACNSAKPNNFAGLADDYFDAANRWSPTNATELGFHEYDPQMEDRSAAAHARRIDTLKGQQARFAALAKSQLTPAEAIDAEIIAAAIDAELHDLDTESSWRRNPIPYVALPGGAIDSLMKRDFAPAAERLRSATLRLRDVPKLFSAMRDNVANPPREFTDIAIRVAEGSVGFFRNDVEAWAKTAAAGDKSLYDEFTRGNEMAALSLESAAVWLKKDLLPRSNGSYAIGAEAFSKRLLYEEMVDLPLDRILAVGEANLERDYNAFVALAHKIDPKRTPAEVVKRLADDHPTEAKLVAAGKETIEGVRQFVVDHKIATVPSEVRPIVAETPAYFRIGNFASMSTVGPFEQMATESYYYVTPPEKNWPQKTKDEHLSQFNPSVFRIITVHEAYPGHYLQFLYSPKFPTKTRKILSAGSNAEGWAHYAEQMMLEQGFGGDDPKIRLAQLQEALLRDCRYVAGIKLHTQGWTVEQATQFFMEKSFYERAIAFEEARRGTYNPTYLYYTLGKLMIYKLREDYQKMKGPSFSLTEFHDNFLRQGSVPLKIVRQIMLPGNSGPLL